MTSLECLSFIFYLSLFRIQIIVINVVITTQAVNFQQLLLHKKFIARTRTTKALLSNSKFQ